MNQRSMASKKPGLMFTMLICSIQPFVSIIEEVTVLNCQAMSVSKTYAEMVEDLRPEFGFTILSDGSVVRGRNPDSYNEELVEYWQKRWKVMKQLGMFDKEKDLTKQLPVIKDNKNDETTLQEVKGDSNEKVKGDSNEKPVHKKRSNHKKDRKSKKK